MSEPLGEHYYLNEEEARTVARALIHFNNYLLGEFDKITGKEDVSDFILNAALQEYQTLTQAGTQLHMRLAEAFPGLRQT